MSKTFVPDMPLRYRRLGLSCPRTCDVCGLPRGSRKVNHSKCSKIRQQRPN